MPNCWLFSHQLSILESFSSLAVGCPRASLYFNLVVLLVHDIEWIERKKNIIPIQQMG